MQRSFDLKGAWTVSSPPKLCRSDVCMGGGTAWHARKSSRASGSKVPSNMWHCPLKSASLMHCQKTCLYAAIVVGVSAPHGRQTCSSSVGALLACFPVHKSTSGDETHDLFVELLEPVNGAHVIALLDFADA